MIGPGVPVFGRVIDRDGELQAIVLRLLLDLGDDFLAGGFGGMDAEDRQSFVREALMPTPVPGVIVDAVDSAEGPEVQSDDASPQPGQTERSRVDPGVDGSQLRGSNGDLSQAREIERLAPERRPVLLLGVGQ